MILSLGLKTYFFQMLKRQSVSQINEKITKTNCGFVLVGSDLSATNLILRSSVVLPLDLICLSITSLAIIDR